MQLRALRGAITVERNDAESILTGTEELVREEWARDLLNRGRSGRVLAINPETGEVRVRAFGLHYAFGVAAVGSDVLVSESGVLTGSGGLALLLPKTPRPVSPGSCRN